MTFSNDSTRNIHRFCCERGEQRHYFDDSRTICAPATVRALCRPIKNANRKCYIKLENVIEVESVGKEELRMIKVCNVIKVEKAFKIEKAMKVQNVKV